jgi:antitoxin component of RelBE/YafQ-DinJ toxin-antitoxin module
MNEKIINFRVDENLKNAFEMIAKNKDLTSSQMLRAFMRETVDEYMKENAQQSLLKPSSTTKKATTKKSVIPDAWRAK